MCWKTFVLVDFARQGFQKFYGPNGISNFKRFGYLFWFTHILAAPNIHAWDMLESNIDHDCGLQNHHHLRWMAAISVQMFSADEIEYLAARESTHWSPPLLQIASFYPETWHCCSSVIKKISFLYFSWSENHSSHISKSSTALYKLTHI